MDKTWISGAILAYPGEHTVLHSSGRAIVELLLKSQRFRKRQSCSRPALIW